MNNKVTVKADKNGNVVSVSPNNPEYGWIFVEQTVPQLENGWLKKSVRSARINGLVSDLLQVNYKAGQELPGKIVVLESFTPFNQQEPDRDLKIAGSSGVICRVNDEPIYRTTLYTSNLNSFDELIHHTNTEEIREVMQAQRSMAALQNRSVQQDEAAL
jgi:hypothetical protein